MSIVVGKRKGPLGKTPKGKNLYDNEEEDNESTYNYYLFADPGGHCRQQI
jgi:hypothetical protein